MKAVILVLSLTLFFSSCSQINEVEKLELSKDFKSYWYGGEAEIAYYDLSRSRYAENREGEMYLIFVTEDFNPKLQVKAENKKSTSVSHFKLNWHQNFPTGIYDYSLMQSTFLSLTEKKNATKLVSSMQEWCGQSYLQLNHHGKHYKAKLHSYFENLNDDYFRIQQGFTENQLLLNLRINPIIDDVPQHMIPNLDYLQLYQKEVKSYAVEVKQSKNDSIINTQIHFPDLNRKVEIQQRNEFPYLIQLWKETIQVNGNEFVSHAKLVNSMKVDYWNKNKEKDLILRQSLKQAE